MILGLLLASHIAGAAFDVDNGKKEHVVRYVLGGAALSSAYLHRAMQQGLPAGNKSVVAAAGIAVFTYEMVSGNIPKFIKTIVK